MKIKDELMEKGFILKCNDREQLKRVDETIMGNLNELKGYSIKVDHDTLEITLITEYSMWTSKVQAYNYNEIWELDKSEIITQRMQKIADMLGIPMDTDIILTKNGSRLICTLHQLTNEGLLNFIGTKVNDILGNLLIGRYEIKQLPFRDRIKKGDKYYYIDTDGLVEYVPYNDSSFDSKMIEIGNFFETKEEASKYELKIVERED